MGASLTTKQRNQIADLRAVANDGIPHYLAKFIFLACEAIERQEYCSTRKQLQEYIDTADHLLNLGMVNHLYGAKK